MQAMLYEHFMRRAFTSTRNTQNGADASFYRKLERSYNAYTNSNIPGSPESKEYEYRQDFAIIRSFVRNAIIHAKKKVIQIQQEKLEGLLTVVSDMFFYDKEELDRIIEASDNILIEAGLEQG